MDEQGDFGLTNLFREKGANRYKQGPKRVFGGKVSKKKKQAKSKQKTRNFESAKKILSRARTQIENKGFRLTAGARVTKRKSYSRKKK
mmetsp:Transcript_10328/g.13424  ORF Transcript_10328/g.13424 Transcript_10328/m.13424 type:complete len:88 (+) Transcript_10328:413-676(+)